MAAAFRQGEVYSVLVKLGIDAYEHGDEISGHCPMHVERTGREDINPSWSINAETGAHNCFSCSYRGSLLGLISDLRDFKTSYDLPDYDAAKEWLSSSIEVDVGQLMKSLEQAKSSYIRLPTVVPMSEARLAVYTDPPEWALEARQVTEEACVKYSVKWSPSITSWILPLREPDSGNLMGWQEKGQLERHFMNRPTGLKKSKTLFGITAWDGGTMVVVESPLDAVKCGGVALCGVTVSDAQFDLMRKADKLIIAFDNPDLDPAGYKALEEFKVEARKRGIEFWVFNYGDSTAKDIGDMSMNAVRWGIDNAVHSVRLGGLLSGKKEQPK
jgi:hypothetical protein